MNDHLSMHKCDCGRPWCEFFDPLEDECGVSYRREDLEEMVKELPKTIKHLKKLLKESL